jgi:hypothetical protein
VKLPTKLNRKLTINALIVEMRFFGILIKSLPTASARKSGLIVAKTISELVEKRKIVRWSENSYVRFWQRR